MVRTPRKVGSVTPTSRPTAEEMARPIDITSGLPVLELGPGTGPITRAILARGLPPERLYLIEYSADLCKHLEALFPDVTIRQGNAFDLDAALAGLATGPFDSVISGVPMLNFSDAQCNDLLGQALDRMAPGRPFVQITYGNRPPIRATDPTIEVTRTARIFRNLPPASVWTYRKAID